MKTKRTNKKSSKNTQSKDIKRSDIRRAFKTYKKLLTLASKGKFTEKLCKKMQSDEYPDLFELADALLVISNFKNLLKKA